MEIYKISTKYSTKMLTDRIDGGRVLDVGGSMWPERANAIAEKADEVIILDPEQPVRETHKKVKHLSLTVEELSPSDGTFDCIVLSNVLEHLAEPQIAMDRCAEVLSPNGQILILSPNRESLNRRAGLQMGLIDKLEDIPEKELTIGHKHMFSVRDIINYASKSKLELEECQGVFLKPVPTPEMIQWPEARIDAFFKIADQIPPELCHEVFFSFIKPKKGS